MLEACLHLRIRCVSVYAFSIENFKRPSEEVNALMKLAEDRFCELCEKGCGNSPLQFHHFYSLSFLQLLLLDVALLLSVHHYCRSLLDEWGVRVSIVGRRALLPPRVRKALERAEHMTRHNDRYAKLYPLIIFL